MTDKQIIIEDQKKTIHRLQDECTEKTNAIIALGEQLKAKEQECERLKNQRDQWISKCEQETKLKEFLEEQLDQLKAELEQEKALKETYLACYKAKHEDIEGALFKLKQTLTEIKELLLKTPTDSPIHCVNAKSVILQEISEAI